MCILRTHSFKWQWFWTSCCLLSSITSKLPSEEMGDWFEGHTFKEVFSDGHIHCRGETYCFHCLRAVVSCCMLWVLQECGYLELGRWGKQEISGLGIWAGFQKLLWKTVSSWWRASALWRDLRCSIPETFWWRYIVFRHLWGAVQQRTEWPSFPLILL